MGRLLLLLLCGFVRGLGVVLGWLGVGSCSRSNEKLLKTYRKLSKNTNIIKTSIRKLVNSYKTLLDNFKYDMKTIKKAIEKYRQLLGSYDIFSKAIESH